MDVHVDPVLNVGLESVQERLERRQTKQPARNLAKLPKDVLEYVLVLACRLVVDWVTLTAVRASPPHRVTLSSTTPPYPRLDPLQRLVLWKLISALVASPGYYSPWDDEQNLFASGEVSLFPFTSITSC